MADSYGDSFAFNFFHHLFSLTTCIFPLKSGASDIIISGKKHPVIIYHLGNNTSCSV